MNTKIETMNTIEDTTTLEVPKKEKKKMYNRSVLHAINEFFEMSFLTGLDEDNSKLFSKAWKTHDNQTNLKNMLKDKMITMKVKKDHSLPTKPLTAYILFNKDCRKKLKEEPNGSNLTFDDVTKYVSSKWKELASENPSEIERYTKMAEKDQERYDTEMKAIDPTYVSKKEKKTKTVKHDVKKPKSAYHYFSEEERPVIIENNPSMEKKQITEELKARWKSLQETDTDRLKYFFDIAKTKKNEYDEQMKLLSSSKEEVGSDTENPTFVFQTEEEEEVVLNEDDGEENGGGSDSDTNEPVVSTIQFKPIVKKLPSPKKRKVDDNGETGSAPVPKKKKKGMSKVSNEPNVIIE